MVLGHVFTFLSLSAFFYLIITPVAILFRLIRRDVMCLKTDETRESYKMSPEPYYQDIAHLKNPY